MHLSLEAELRRPDWTMAGLCFQLAALLLLLRLPSPAQGADGSQDQPVFSRIIGGQDAQEGKWSWQVSVQFGGNHICGGSLIAAQWVVSAAHCFNPSASPSQYRMVLGVHQLADPSPSQVTHEVQQIIPYPGYNETSLTADIALVRLEKPVTVTNFTRPIALPGFCRPFQMGDRCWITGWGDVNTSMTSQTLQKMEIPIVSTAKCDEQYNVSKAGSRLDQVRIDCTLLCAGFTNSSNGIYRGDSGGPLACQQGGTWYLAGVTSWYLAENMTSLPIATFPGVFTRVTVYESWIQGHMNGAGPSAITSPATLLFAALLLAAL